MAPRHTTHKWFASARDAVVLAILLTVGFSTQAQAGLTTTKADIEIAKKEYAETEAKIEELEKQVNSLQKENDSAQAKASASQKRKELTEKDLARTSSEIGKKTALQAELDAKAMQTKATLKALEKEVETLEIRKEKLQDTIKENTTSIQVPDYIAVTCQEDDEAKKKAEEEAAEKAEAAKKAAAEANAEPGFFRKRALKKGAKPETPGETKWLQAEKDRDAAEKKAAAEKVAAEMKAKAEKLAAEAKEKAEREAAEKAEAAKKAEAEANAEPSFFRKRALKKGAKPETPGETKWLQAEKDRDAAEKKAAAEKTAAEKKAEAEKLAAEKKAEAEKLAAEAKEKAEKDAAEQAEKAAAAKAKAEKLAAEAKEKAEREAAEKAEEAKKIAARANAEPGYFRKRALKKGAKPETPGETKWLQAEKNREAAEKKAEAEKLAAVAKEKAEKEAAAKKAEAERLASMAKEDATKEAARKAKEAEKAAAMAKVAAVKANEEPGFFRKRELKKGAKPETPGETKWLQAEKEREAADAAAVASRKKEAEEKEAASRRKIEEDAEKRRLAKLNEVPGWGRQRALKSGRAKPETPGEKKWYDQWQAELAKEKEAKASEEKQKTEALAAKKAAEVEERKKRDLEPPGYFRKKALIDGEAPETTGEKAWYKNYLANEKQERAKQDQERATREAVRKAAKNELTKVENQLLSKRKELEVIRKSAKTSAELASNNAEELERSKKVNERAKSSIQAVTEKAQALSSIAAMAKEKYMTESAKLKVLKDELHKRQEKLNKTRQMYVDGVEKYKRAESSRLRYFNAKEKTDILQSDLMKFIELAAEREAQKPIAIERVNEITKLVADARLAYDNFRKTLYTSTNKSSDELNTILIIDSSKKAKTREDKALQPFAEEVARTVKELRAAEVDAKRIIHDADYYAFKVRKTKFEIKRNSENLKRYKNDYDQALEELKPWGTLDPLPPKPAPTKEDKEKAEKDK